MPDPVFDTSPGRHDWPAGQVPVVFHKAPTHYAVVKPEGLAEWERLTADAVGLKLTVAEDFAASWLQTTSFCGEKPDGDPNPCDSDILPTALEA